jgi:hypothetical protein
MRSSPFFQNAIYQSAADAAAAVFVSHCYIVDVEFTRRKPGNDIASKIISPMLFQRTYHARHEQQITITAL